MAAKVSLWTQLCPTSSVHGEVRSQFSVWEALKHTTQNFFYSWFPVQHTLVTTYQSLLFLFISFSKVLCSYGSKYLCIFVEGTLVLLSISVFLLSLCSVFLAQCNHSCSIIYFILLYKWVLLFKISNDVFFFLLWT